MIAFNNLAALNSNLYIAGHPALLAAGSIQIAPAASVTFSVNANNIALIGIHSLLIDHSIGNVTLHGLQPDTIVVQGGDVNLTLNDIDALSSQVTLEDDAQVTLNSANGFDIKIWHNDEMYNFVSQSQNLTLDEVTLDYLAMLLETSDLVPPLYLAADEFADNVLDLLSASELCKIQAINKDLIHSFIKSNALIHDANGIPCDADETQYYMEQVMQSVNAKVRLVDARFLEMNDVVRSLEAIKVIDKSAPCPLIAAQQEAHYEPEIWPEVFAFLSADDIATELAGADDEKDDSE